MEDKRVIVTRPMMGLTAMQVCCVKDATNEEILKVCNEENPAGTTAGWSLVLRTKEDIEKYNYPESCLPVACSDNSDREHILILC